MSSNNSLKSISSKINKIEEIVGNFYKSLPKKNTENFILNKLEYKELEELVDFIIQNYKCPTSSNKNDNNENFTHDHTPYDLSNYSIKELENLVNFTTQNFNNDKHPHVSTTTSTNRKDKTIGDTNGKGSEERILSFH